MSDEKPELVGEGDDKKDPDKGKKEHKKKDEKKKKHHEKKDKKDDKKHGDTKSKDKTDDPSKAEDAEASDKKDDDVPKKVNINAQLEGILGAQIHAQIKKTDSFIKLGIEAEKSELKTKEAEETGEEGAGPPEIVVEGSDNVVPEVTVDTAEGMPVEEKPSRFKLFKKNKKIETSSLDVTNDEDEKHSIKSAGSGKGFNRRSKMFNPFKSVRKVMASVRFKGRRAEPVPVPEECPVQELDVQELCEINDEVKVVEDCRKGRARGPQGRKRRSMRPPTLAVTQTGTAGNSNVKLDSILDVHTENEVENSSEGVTKPGTEPVSTNVNVVKLENILDVRLKKTDSFVKTEIEAENLRKAAEAEAAEPANLSVKPAVVVDEHHSDDEGVAATEEPDKPAPSSDISNVTSDANNVAPDANKVSADSSNISPDSNNVSADSGSVAIDSPDIQLSNVDNLASAKPQSEEECAAAEVEEVAGTQEELPSEVKELEVNVAEGDVDVKGDGDITLSSELCTSALGETAAKVELKSGYSDA